MPNNPIIDFFTKHFYAKLNHEQEQMVIKMYRREVYDKKTLIFNAGDTNTRHYVIETGLLRLYLIDTKGKEINLLFARENQIIGDLTTPEATNFYLETIENSVVYSIDEAGMQILMNELNIGNAFGPNNGLRRSYIHIQKRLVSLLSKSAEENFKDFKISYPDLVQRLPQYHIAGYLGISPEFLSKVIARSLKK